MEDDRVLKELEARIADLEVKFREFIFGGREIADDRTNGCTHGCTGGCPDPTGDCTYGCTYNCTHGCTASGCAPLFERPKEVSTKRTKNVGNA